MNASRTYLDHNATTPLHPSVRDAMLDALDHLGNPSSIHAEGRASRAIVETARRDVAALMGCAPDDVIFTSGATEALNMVLTPDVTSAAGPMDVLLIGAGEHSAVKVGHRFAAGCSEIIPTKSDGTLDLDALEAALVRHAGRRIMLAVQAANNETGVIQPVAQAAQRVQARSGFVVCDAVQVVGKTACRLDGLGADAMAISAHKFGGPKGVGALIFASRTHHLRHGVVRGGGQERGLRSGTENLSGIAGMGAAARFAMAQSDARSRQLAEWRDAIERIIVAQRSDAVIFGRDAARVPNTVCFAAPGYDAQVLLMNLDLGGVAVSAGSACSSGKVKPSPVLEAMGVSPVLAKSSLRISLGWTTCEADIAAFETALATALRVIRPKAAQVAA